MADVRRFQSDVTEPASSAESRAAGVALATPLPYWLVRSTGAAELRRYNASQMRDPNGKWGDGVPGPSTDSFDMSGLSDVVEVEGTFGDLAMGLHDTGDVRMTFRHDGQVRELDLGIDEVGELRDAVERLVGERANLPDDADLDAVYDEEWFGIGQHHKVSLVGNELIEIVFGADEDDPWTLSLDPPYETEDEDVDDAHLLLDAVDHIFDASPDARSSSGVRSAAPDDEGEEWEEAIAAIVAALSELSDQVRAAGFDPGKHPRGAGGKFRSTVDKLKAAIETHQKSGGKGDPFEGFDREQLRRAAKTRGITLTRGEGRDSIAKKLLDDLGGNSSTEAPKAEAPVKKAPAKRAPRKKATPPPAPKPVTSSNRYHDDLSSPALRSLADTVEHGSVEQEVALSGGVAGDTRKRVYGDGTQTVWKRSKPFRNLDAEHQADAEELAPLVAHALGLNAPAVYRGDERTVHMEFVDDATVDWDFPIFNNEQPRSDQGRMLGLLDLLINNPDRHRGNIMVKNSDGSIIPIDHGLAWSMLDTIEPARPSRDVRNPYMDHFFSSFHEKWTDNDLSPADIAAIRKRLKPLKPAFDNLGRGDWFDFMTERLDAIAPFAKGAKPRLGAEIT